MELPARSTAVSLALATALARTVSNASPPSVERRRPVGPTRSAVDVSGAKTAFGRAVVPVSSVLHVAPLSFVRNRPPAKSRATPTVAEGKDTSRTPSDVETLPRVHVRPPSTVLASVPLSPGANAVPAWKPASMRLNVPLKRPPIGANLTPATSEIAVEPMSPPATIRVGEANAAAWIGSGDAVTSVAESPPSVVRTSWSPRSVVMTHTCALAQRIEVRVAVDPANGCGDHVAPPSAVLRNRD